MRRKDVIELYDDEYAEQYNDRFLLADVYRQTTQVETDLLARFLGNASSWLDVGCGTGYMLSRFPSVRRCGLDLSPAMLRVAVRANPGTEFVAGDFLAERPEWHGKWDLVTCMWQAYCYLDTVDEVALLIRNLAAWTAVGGTCFVPLCDLERFCAQSVPFRRPLDTADGALQIDAIVWSCLEPTGRKHVNLIAPHRNLLIEEFEPFFSSVRVLEYPGWNADAAVSRPAALVAEGRASRPLRIPTKPATHSEAKAATLPGIAASRAHGGSKWPP
jgi:SAM-dependent methyltransferase